MRNFHLGLVALTAVFASAALPTTASAHPVGERCYFQRIDEDGVVRNGSTRCHHLPSRYRNSPRSGFSLFFDFGDGYYFDRRPRRVGNAYGRDQVCLVTFFKRSQVAAGADVNVQRARVMPRRQAQRIDGPNDRHRIFDYGTNRKTRETCRYLNNINN